MNPESSAQTKKSYYTHVTNLKITGKNHEILNINCFLAIDILPRPKANRKVISFIKIYVQKMKENNTTNARYFCILLNTLNEVSKFITSEVSERRMHHKELKSVDEEIKEILRLTHDLVKLMDPKYHDEELKEGSVYANEILSQLLSTSRRS